MIRWMLFLICCCLVGCKSGEKDSAKSLAEQQEQMVHGMDHKTFYDGCQTLMRLHREGKLSRNSFYRDDLETNMDELPEVITSLEPMSVYVNEMMVNVTFLSEEGTQTLMCFSNEFGTPPSDSDGSKGMGFRTNPTAVDRLSGTETLAELNEEYDDFQIDLIPGLMYTKGKPDPASSLEEAKQNDRQMNALLNAMEKNIGTLAAKKQRLLYHTDHRALLKACREVIARYEDGVYSQAKIDIVDASAKDIEQISQIILDLEPVYVWPSQGRVMVGLIGGFVHAGVLAHSSDDVTAGDDEIKLTDGLFYYDDGLREADEDYRDYLADLEHNACTYLHWKRKQMNSPAPDRQD